MGANGQLQLTSAPGPAAGASRDGPTNRAVERLNVSVNPNGQISLRQEAAQGNESPTGIVLVEVSVKEQGLLLEIADFRRSDVSQYRATLPDGSALPAWIQVDPSTGKVSVDSGRAGQLIEMRFIAQDINGGLRTLEIKIDLSSQRSQNELAPAATQQQALARPAFMNQLAEHQRQWDGYGEQLLSVFTE